MQTHTKSYTAEDVITSLGYPNPMDAARQQARMLLLGRLARYQAEVQQMESKWGCTLKDMRARYTVMAHEDFQADDDYLQWQWYVDAIEAINAQLAAIA